MRVRLEVEAVMIVMMRQRKHQTFNIMTSLRDWSGVDRWMVVSAEWWWCVVISMVPTDHRYGRV